MVEMYSSQSSPPLGRGYAVDLLHLDSGKALPIWLRRNFPRESRPARHLSSPLSQLVTPMQAAEQQSIMTRARCGDQTHQREAGAVSLFVCRCHQKLPVP